LRTVVTGGAGFIGSHLVDRLIGDGHSVTVIDNFANGNPANLKHLEGNTQLSVHVADLAESRELDRLVDGTDWVFHLAGLADIVPSINDPRKYTRANVDGTVAILEAARNAGVKRLVYAASSSCYGLPNIFPTPETSTISPMYPYALSKYLAEECVMHWCQVYQQPSVSLRLFNVYGPRSRTTGAYGAVFGVFLAQKLAGKPYTVVGDGNQSRDFTYVTDVADAFVAAAESDISGEIFNVGSGDTYSINQVVGLLGGEVVHLPKRPGEPDCTFADITKIRTVLGWQPTVGLEDGISRILDNIHLWQNAPVWDTESIEVATRDWFKYLGTQPEGKPTE